METKKMAVVQVKNTQYLVKEGETVQIDRYDAEPGSKLKFDEVLLVIDGDKTTVGTPVIAKASVEAEVVEHAQGPKIRTFTFKAKARERNVRGNRSKFTVIKITKIN